MAPKGWNVVDVSGAIGTLRAVHVMPVDDLRIHLHRVTCWCAPAVEVTPVRLLVIHNSVDGRELVERHGVN